MLSTLLPIITPAFREKLIEKNVPKEKIIFIPNAADFEISDGLINSEFDRDEFRKNSDLEGRQVITYVGAHGVANHLIQVLDTAEILKQRGDTKTLFLLIGAGMRKKFLKMNAQERKLDNVRFIDPVPKTDVFKYIYASDFGMSVLKKVDTFKTIYSNKTFDYMACKRPIFMVIDGVSRQLVEEASCGVYVEPENPSDFADKIEEYGSLSLKELEQAGNRGYQFAKENFDRNRLALRYIEYLQSICNEKK